MLWSFLSRDGVKLIKRWGDPKKSVYFKGFIDRGRNSTEWGPNDVTTDVISGETYTCETGILPGHRPTAIADLVENFEIFLSGDFTKMTHYLRGNKSPQIREIQKKLAQSQTYG